MGRANHTLADLLALLIRSDTLGWERLDLQQARVQEVSTNGGEVEYTARIGLSSVSAAARPAGQDHRRRDPGRTASATSPARPSMARTAPRRPSPTRTITGQILTWTFDIGVDVDFQDLVFQARPGLRLGPAVTSVDVTPLGGAAATDDETVTVGDTYENNDTIPQAAPLNDTSFFLSYLTSADDVDMFKFAVPATPGTRVTFRLSHVPADYDIVVYGPSGQVLRPSPPGTPPLDGFGIADEGASLTSTSDALAPQPLDDVPVIEGQAVVGLSTLRGTQDDGVTVVSDGGGWQLHRPGDGLQRGFEHGGLHAARERPAAGRTALRRRHVTSGGGRPGGPARARRGFDRRQHRLRRRSRAVDGPLSR